MGMTINQEYMDGEVIKPMMLKFAEVEKSIEKLNKKINLAQIDLNYLRKIADKKIIEKKVK